MVYIYLVKFLFGLAVKVQMALVLVEALEEEWVEEWADVDLVNLLCLISCSFCSAGSWPLFPYEFVIACLCRFCANFSIHGIFLGSLCLCIFTSIVLSSN